MEIPILVRRYPYIESAQTFCEGNPTADDSLPLQDQ